MDRREFLSNVLWSGCAVSLGLPLFAGKKKEHGYLKESVSKFSQRLVPVGRVLEEEGYYVWCNSPIYGPDGQVHLFYSRWPSKYGMGGWIHKCEIARAVATSPEGPFVFQETVLEPREGFFDATTCHNPTIHFIDGMYYLFYMGNSNGKTNTKRIGLATSLSLQGPWARRSAPLLEAGHLGAWDDHCTTNPAFVRHPDGRCLLYYKSWNTADYENAPKDATIRGNRKYGLAVAGRPEGPYVKYEGNPVIDFRTEVKTSSWKTLMYGINTDGLTL
ncbi:MAG: glycoside hydrolase family protein [Breznakibacter sp.]